LYDIIALMLFVGHLKPVKHAVGAILKGFCTLEELPQRALSMEKTG